MARKFMHVEDGARCALAPVERLNIRASTASGVRKSNRYPLLFTLSAACSGQYVTKISHREHTSRDTRYSKYGGCELTLPRMVRFDHAARDQDTTTFSSRTIHTWRHLTLKLLPGNILLRRRVLGITNRELLSNTTFRLLSQTRISVQAILRIVVAR